MKKINKISYFYFATGLTLSLYSIFSQKNQVLNIDDTYYVISGNNFALFVSLIYLIFSTIFLVMEKYIGSGLKVFQYLMFNIPFIYFIFVDLDKYNNPGYYLGNPIAYKWNTMYIPIGLIFCFLISIILFFSYFGYAFWKWKNNKAS